MLVVEKTPLSWMREDNLDAMMYAHWRECSIDHDDVPLDPHWELASTMERCGVLHSFGLFEDGELIGYAVFEVSRHLLHRQTKYAWNVGMYVEPEHRKGNAGIKLFVECEKALARMGVKKITYLAPNASPLNRLLEAAEYRATELYYTKMVN